MYLLFVGKNSSLFFFPKGGTKSFIKVLVLFLLLLFSKDHSKKE